MKSIRDYHAIYFAGTLCNFESAPLKRRTLIFLQVSRISIAGSLIGGVKETQEVVDFCFHHGIYPDCKVIEAKDIDWCWDQLDSTNADGIRFVIDIKKSLKNKDFLPK